MKWETIAENIIEIDVANPLTILSAYFITAAITKPPSADRAIINKANLSIPWNHPFSDIAFASTKATLSKANKIPKKPFVNNIDF